MQAAVEVCKQEITLGKYSGVDENTMWDSRQETNTRVCNGEGKQGLSCNTPALSEESPLLSAHFRRSTATDNPQPSLARCSVQPVLETWLSPHAGSKSAVTGMPWILDVFSQPCTIKRPSNLYLSSFPSPIVYYATVSMSTLCRVFKSPSVDTVSTFV